MNARGRQKLPTSILRYCSSFAHKPPIERSISNHNFHRKERKSLNLLGLGWNIRLWGAMHFFWHQNARSVKRNARFIQTSTMLFALLLAVENARSFGIIFIKQSLVRILTAVAHVQKVLPPYSSEASAFVFQANQASHASCHCRDIRDQPLAR